MSNEKSILELILPDGVFEWFDVAGGVRDENDLKIVLEEKNIPPDSKGKKIISKGFTDITITDFPIRGRRTLLTFRRRYWQVEGEQKLLKRDIKLNFPGTQLEQEFAVFLKDSGRELSNLAGYLGYTKPPSDKTV